jgi:FtsP/CotA-like multicopper oxidase with cupredoxin domain
MSVHELRLHSCEVVPLALERGQGSIRELSRRRTFVQRWLPAALFAIVVVMLHASPARAQEFVPCPDEQQPLVKVPELASQGGKLRGTIVLSDEQERIPVRQPSNTLPGDPGTVTKCQPQYVRILRGVNASPSPSPSTGPYPDPMPGPTLRARVGDLIQLIFINQINPGHFGRSIDNGETGVGCDQTPGIYPQGGKINDQYPDCFHGSSTGNIHFHGTHTNPNSTGDNVFVEVRPLPRDNAGKLTVSPEKVQKYLDVFFAQCEKQLSGSVLQEWPKLWGDLPSDWTGEQKDLLIAYDKQLVKLYGDKAKQLWPVDAGQLLLGQWPQYYIGAYPYCYRLPEYTANTWSWPSPGQAPMQMSGMGTRMGGAGTAELRSVGASPAQQGEVSPSLIMGQAPGTHWYHAHKHGSTAINVANGMTGAFIIEGQYDDDINAFYGAGWTRTAPVMVINQLGVTPNLERGAAGRTNKGPDFSVNGQIMPVIQMRPGEVQMWRIINTSGRASAFFSAPPQDSKGNPNQYEWRQLAQDGVQFNDANYQKHHNKSFLLAAGNRADLLVKALPCANNAQKCTYPVIVRNEVDPTDLVVPPISNKVTLVSINVAGSPVDPNSPGARFMPNAPQHFPPFLADITSGEVKDNKRTMRFSSTGPGKGGVHKIDGKQFDGEVGALVKLNTVEEWKIINETYGPKISHPFHIHINPFQVVEVFSPNDTITVPDPKRAGKTITVPQYIFDPNAQVSKKQCLLNPLADPDDWKPCGPPPVNKDGIWWDVFPIPSGIKATDAKNNPIIDPKTKQQLLVPGYFKMRSRFVDYSGFYVLHCHILAHEDRGMMTVVEVSPSRPPYSHN